jgi:pyrophosphatase PpaX
VGPTPRRGYDRPVRFPVVLFDLDGTLIDSGPIILASMQHAVRTVLDREVAYEELAATVGGQGLVAQMRALDPERVHELVEVYREHNDPLHDTLEAFEELLAVLPQLQAEGRKLGIVTAKRHRTVALALDRFPALGELFDVVVAHEDTIRHKPDAEPVLAAVERLGARPADAAYVGDSPFDIQAAKAAQVFAIAVGWGGIHPDERLRAEEPDAFVHSPEELLDVL